MNLPEYAFPKVPAPHLRSSAAFEGHLARELISALMLWIGAVLFKGPAFVVFSGIIVAAAVIVRTGICFFSGAKLRLNAALIQQALLCSFFLPAFSVQDAACAGALMGFLFYACGERQGRVVQPACLALVIFSALHSAKAPAQFVLSGAAPALSGAIFTLWFSARIPRTAVEAVKMSPLAGLVLLLSFLHETNFFFALLWSVAAFDLIFDGAVAPLSKKGSIVHTAAVFVLWTLLLAAGARADAFIISGLASGFLAAWIEERTLKRESYGKTPR